MANQNIRGALLMGGIKHYEVAAAMGITESGLSRKLRNELSAQEQQRIFNYIKV